MSGTGPVTNTLFRADSACTAADGFAPTIQNPAATPRDASAGITSSANQVTASTLGR